ncbi:MAG: c-type cytochrome [Rhodospirillaceae bacterium]|nr:c-type cytochrome [Rhodospirillaceae bacterium]
MFGKTNLIIIGVILVVMAAIGSAYVDVIEGGGGKVVGADPMNAELVAQGQTIYSKSCADCHGSNLEGQPNWKIKGADGMLPAPPHDATGHTWHHPDKMLFEVTKLGGGHNAPAGFISGMPAFGDSLSDEDIYAVLAYIKSRWPDDIRKRHKMMSERAG